MPFRQDDPYLNLFQPEDNRNRKQRILDLLRRRGINIPNIPGFGGGTQGGMPGQLPPGFLNRPGTSFLGGGIPGNVPGGMPMPGGVGMPGVNTMPGGGGMPGGMPMPGMGTLPGGGGMSPGGGMPIPGGGMPGTSLLGGNPGGGIRPGISMPGGGGTPGGAGMPGNINPDLLRRIMAMRNPGG